MTEQTFITCAALEGKVQGDINEAIARIVASFDDEEISPRAKRRLTIELTFNKQDADSLQILYAAHTETKIPGPSGRSGSLEIEDNGDLRDVMAAEQLKLDLQVQAAAGEAEFVDDPEHAPGGGNGEDQPKKPRGRPRKSAIADETARLRGINETTTATDA